MAQHYRLARIRKTPRNPQNRPTGRHGDGRVSETRHLDQSRLQGVPAWDAFQAERYHRDERGDYPAVSENPFRHQQRDW